MLQCNINMFFMISKTSKIDKNMKISNYTKILDQSA